MYKPAVAVLGTTCLLMGLFLRYTLASNIKTKKTIEEIQRDVSSIQQQLAARSKSGTNTPAISGTLPVQRSLGGNINSPGVGHEGKLVTPVGQTST